MSGLAEFVYTTVLRPAPLKRVANALILSVLPKTVRVGPAVVHLNPNDPVLSGALGLQVYERQEIRYFQQACKPSMTVIDVGANVGLYTALAMHLCPYGRIVAIEPHSESRAFLERTIGANAGPLNASVHVMDCAASDHIGRAELYLNPDNKADNRLYRSGMTSCAQSVQLRTIDDMLAGLGIEKIDILKIDVQGAEFPAISGAEKTIRQSPNLTLMTEFWPDGIEQASRRSGRDYLDMLRDFGFVLYQLRFGALRPIAEDLADRLTGRRYANLIGIKADHNDDDGMGRRGRPSV
jgi:FkbM family methyltransferase